MNQESPRYRRFALLTAETVVLLLAQNDERAALETNTTNGHVFINNCVCISNVIPAITGIQL